MRLCRFLDSSSNEPRHGFVDADTIYPVTVNEFFRPGELPHGQPAIALSTVHLAAPVAPSKIVCVGRNYRDHAAELGNKMPEEPLLFLKPSSAVIGNDQVIKLPPQSNQVEHEGELGVVIGKTAQRLSAEDNPLDYVLGYTCVNDVTARDLQRKDVQFTRGKSFDTFCPVGPVIVTGIDPTSLDVVTRLNGNIKQKGNTADMAFPVPFLIKYISNIMTLYPGDLIATGTPAGVSRMKPDDVVEVEIEGVGVLRNKIEGQ